MWLLIPVVFPWVFALTGRLLEIGLYAEAGLLAGIGAAVAGWAARPHGLGGVVLSGLVAFGLAAVGFANWLLLLALLLDFD